MKENKVIILTMVLNLLVAIIKLVSGLLFSFSTLIADSIQSFIDFVTDITSLIANRIGKRRTNKTYPFGYGQVYYLANLFTGFLLFLIGIFIMYQFFYFKGELKPSLTLLVVLLIVLVLKMIVVKILKHYGKLFKSELMIEASKESYTDFISTLVVLIIFGITALKSIVPFEFDVDKLGSLCMAIYVFYTSIKMMIHNIRGMLTNDSENNEIKEEILKELKKYENIQFKNISVINMSTYYSVFIQVKVDDNLTIKEFLLLERKIKTHLRNKNKLLRVIDVEPV